LAIAAAGKPAAAQEETTLPANEQPGSVRSVTDFDAKVSPELPVTYLELIRKVFPERRRGEYEISAYYDANYYRLHTARGTVALRELTAKPASPVRYDSPVHFNSVRALVLGKNKRHIALVIRAEPSVMGETDFFVLAVFSLSATPRLLAAFEGGGFLAKFDFDDEFFLEEETENGAQFWVVRSPPQGTEETQKEYFLLELRNELVRVIVEDLPAKRTENGCGYKQTTDYYFSPVLVCGQETFSAGRKIDILRIYEEWLATDDDCREARPKANLKREREYSFYWNKRLLRYQKRFETEDYYVTDVSDKNVVTEKDFKGFDKPKTLGGKAVLLNKVYDLTIYGGDKYWDWTGSFEAPPRELQSIEFNFYFVGDYDFQPQKYETRRFRVDVRFVVTSVRRRRNEDGSWSNTYTCYIVAARER
jgi:hypothetical protein